MGSASVLASSCPTLVSDMVFSHSQPCCLARKMRASVAYLRRVSVRVKEMFVCSDLIIVPGMQQILKVTF